MLQEIPVWITIWGSSPPLLRLLKHRPRRACEEVDRVTPLLA